MLGVGYVSAASTWVGPTATPPGNNTDSPLNAGYDGQIKQGNLWIKGLTSNGVAELGLIVENGNVGIGTGIPEAVLDVSGSVNFGKKATTYTYNRGNKVTTPPMPKTYTQCPCDVGIAVECGASFTSADGSLSGCLDTSYYSYYSYSRSNNVLSPRNPFSIDSSGKVSVFGSWNVKEINIVYKADTDGFVVGWSNNSTGVIYTDSNNPPTTIRSKDTSDGAGDQGSRNVFSPIRKGDYWKATGVNGGLYWLPLGAAN